uniref:G-protein coupled receptors family 3 profile domain-containing protein n=1 Tax=Xenopus tropicalis TaxID=8364 RepID=K9J819_XENTR
KLKIVSLLLVHHKKGPLESPGLSIVIAKGLFILRYYNFSRFLLCFSTSFGIEFYQSMQALIFAIEEINADPELLPNITLGFQIFDSCITLRRAAQGALWILSGGPAITPNYNCHKGAPLAGIIGDCGSTQSILIISYLSSHPILSDQNLFPSFFRTIPSDDFQMRGLAQLISYFGWSWLGILANDDDYGQYGTQMAKQEIMNVGACVAFAEKIIIGQPNRNAPHIVQVIKESTAKVVVVITTDPDFMIIIQELLRQNVTGNIWVASEGWSTSVLLSEELFRDMLLGTIGFAIHGRKMPEFTKYLNSLHPSKDPQDSFIRQFWEKNFSCKWLNQSNLFETVGNTTLRPCTGNEKLETLMTEHRISLNIYTAAYTFAWALQSLLECTPGNGPFYQGTCANITSFRPWHLLHYIQNVKFQARDGSQVSFDAKGNPPVIYDIVNWHMSTKGTQKQILVGHYQFNAPNERNLTVDTTSIIWPNNNKQVPISKCTPSCSSGFRKMTVPGKPPCCYECARCPQGQISNETDAVECHPCSWDTWPNLQQDRCLPRPTEFLSYGDPLGYSLAVISIFSSWVPVIILGVFICYKKTPVVRANNYSLSCLLLLSLFLCFLCSLGFIGYPQPEKCLLRQVAFGMVFALCISCVLAKTITVVIAFNATKPGTILRKWTGLKVSYSVIVLSAFIQLCVCLLWLIFSPPFSELNSEDQPGIIIINCNEGSPAAFWCMLGYLGLLATISFIVAFLARRLPDSFNEATFITFSMLAFLSVWVSFIPAYLSARGMYTVAMEVFAILSSTWAVVVCIFVPKCFVVLFRPTMNSKELLRRKDIGQH